MMKALAQELSNIDQRFKSIVERPGGLSNAELQSLISRPDADPAAYYPEQATLDDVVDFSTNITVNDMSVGSDAIDRGEVAMVVLAGGAGTRLGAPKALVRLEGIGTTLLGWKLMQAGGIPVWVMSSSSLSAQLQKYVSTLALPPGLQGVIFEQFEGYRLTPDNHLSTISDGVPDMYPLGHGDVGPALIESGIITDNPKVKYVVVCNVDNVLAEPHVGIIGQHIRSGCKVTCEVIDKTPADKGGGVLVRANGQLQIAESFRLPDGFSDEALFFNTNTMVIDVEVLTWSIPWRWHRVRKHVGSRLVIQYERLLQQYTEECATNFLKVPRDLRYLGIKTPEDLVHASKVLESHRFK